MLGTVDNSLLIVFSGSNAKLHDCRNDACLGKLTGARVWPERISEGEVIENEVQRTLRVSEASGSPASDLHSSAQPSN